MKKFLIPLLCSAILLLCGGCNLSDKVRIGTAAEGGYYYIFGSELNAIDSLESYNINTKERQALPQICVCSQKTIFRWQWFRPT